MKKGFNLFILSLIMLPATAIAQTFSVNASGDDPYTYNFEVTGLERLESIPEREARWELFFETGDGYYRREEIANPSDNSDVFSFSHTYTHRVPDPSDMKMTATPIYSPNKKPVILGNNPLPPDIGAGMITFPNYPDFLSDPDVVKIDLNWSMLEAEDRFTVIGGYRAVSNQSNVDLSKGGIISIYYNEALVEYLPGTEGSGYRSYDNIPETTEDFGDDVVYQDYEGAFNAHIDFIFPPDTSSTGSFPFPEFVYANFKVKSPEEVGETEVFEIAAVVRAGQASSVPTPSNYQISKMQGHLEYGKDPNSITGIPDTVCFPNGSLTHFQYHVEFFNEGNASVDHATMEISLPEHIKLEDGPLNMKLLEARWGSADNLPLQYFHYCVTAAINPNGPDKVLIEIYSVKDLSNEYAELLSLFGFKDEYLVSYPDYYSKCSAEFLFEFERDMTLNTCDPDNPIDARLEITFPSMDVVVATDTIACDCQEPPVVFPCNVVPDIPFLGGCWCTLLVILMLLIILFLIFVIWRNSQS